MNKLVISARSVARRLGLVRLYYRLRPQNSYEEDVHTAVLKMLHKGDVIWDIGANTGYYTKIFCEIVGPEGRVLAFEPAPETFAELCRQTEAFPWVRAEQLALSDFDGTSCFAINETYQFVNHLQPSERGDNSSSSVDVSVLRGDSYWASSGITPNVIKIDVEGFEEEVLNGMAGLLTARELRAVLIEVHFSLLEDRGHAFAPVRIEKLLRRSGLKPRWVDVSHIVAERN